ARGPSARALLKATALVDTGAILALLDRDRKSTRLNSSHVATSYAVFCLKKKTPLVAAPAAVPEARVPVPPAPLPKASRTWAWLAREPHAATRTRAAASATMRRRLRARCPTAVRVDRECTSDPPGPDAASDVSY